MPYAIDITLKTTRILPESRGTPHRATNALLYRWLDAAEPRLAHFVHEEADPKPFTLSSLNANGDECYHFRATLLEDEYWPYIERGMKRERTIRAGDRILAMHGDVQIAHRTYAEIAQAAEARWEIILHFDSPASFKSRQMHYPLPDPMLVFASYRARWNAFAPAELQIEDGWMEWVEQAVAVARLELRTQMIDFGQYQQVGCIGTVQYDVIDRSAGSKLGRAPLNALADYATFCGTGHKTTQGMGQTRRLDRWTNETGA